MRMRAGIATATKRSRGGGRIRSSSPGCSRCAAVSPSDRRARSGLRHRPLFLGREQRRRSPASTRRRHAGRSAPSGARRRITARELRWCRAIWRRIKFPDGSFDLVYSIGVLAEHVPLDAVARRACLAMAETRRPVCLHDRRSPIARRAGHLQRSLATAMLPVTPGRSAVRCIAG